MCIQKILNWFKEDPVIPQTPSSRKALLFAINNYPGSQHDLDECLHDQEFVVNTITRLYGGNFDILTFRDSEVTKARFLGEIEAAILVLRPGDVLLIHYSGHGTQVYDIHGDEADGYDEALYLYDGVVLNKDIHETLMKIPEGSYVTLSFDSCFSATLTNPRDLKRHKVKFVPYMGRKQRKKRITAVAKIDINSNWITFSACGENEVAYDGAFTPIWMALLDPKMKNWQWENRVTDLLPSDDFPQSPTLEGRTDLLDRQVLT